MSPANPLFLLLQKRSARNAEANNARLEKTAHTSRRQNSAAQQEMATWKVQIRT
jgi:hypothetical protein